VGNFPYLAFAVAAGAMLPLPATLVALILAGQALASLTVDHFGLVGFEENPVTPGRHVGIALVAVGAAFVRGL
jgi:transporter family-2 protein